MKTLSQEWTAAQSAKERALVVAKLRAEIEARKALAAPIMAAFRAGDLAACEDAQRAFRRRFQRQN
jgi:hypothetical protein